MECRSASENRFGGISDTSNCTEMRFWVRVTRGYFFLLGASRLADTDLPPNLAKKITSGTQGRLAAPGSPRMETPGFGNKTSSWYSKSEDIYFKFRTVISNLNEKLNILIIFLSFLFCEPFRQVQKSAKFK